jgi:hypothetical protein
MSSRRLATTSPLLLLAAPALAQTPPAPPPAVTAPVVAVSSVAPAPVVPAASIASTPIGPDPDRRSFALAVFAEGALGFSGDGFYNQLVGPRLDYHAGERLTLGLALSYANLKGPNGRVSNVLPAAMLEWRAPLANDVALPVRFFSGYLPRNGPWLKLALGLSRRLSPRTTLTFEALAPTLWVVRNTTVSSFDASLELTVAL